MAEILGMETGIDLPDLATSQVGMYIMLGIIIIVLLIITALVVWWYYMKTLYKFRIVIFENIGGKGWQKTMIDHARYLRLSKDGTEVFYLRKKKMPLTAYGRKMGINEYWFAIGQDGGWYNIALGDLDAKMGVLDIEPVDRDIKYVSVAMRKNAAENYGAKLTFMDKYGSWVMGGVTMIILLAAGWFYLEKFADLTSQLASASSEFAKTQEPITKALGYVDSICSGGTGLRPS